MNEIDGIEFCPPLILRTGDKVILETPEAITQDQAYRIREHLRCVFPDVEFAIVSQMHAAVQPTAEEVDPELIASLRVTHQPYVNDDVCEFCDQGSIGASAALSVDAAWPCGVIRLIDVIEQS